MKKTGLFIIIFAISALFCCASAYRDISVKNDKGLYIIHIPRERIATIKPYVVRFLSHNRTVYENTGAELVINAGYFDANNKKTASYVMIDEEIVLNPEENEALTKNAAIQPYMNKILDRTEFRILDCKGFRTFDIQKHSTPVSGSDYTGVPPRKRSKCKIVHSIQAGPQIYPKLTLEEEAFVVKENGKVVRDSIYASKRCARTAIGIKDNDIYILIATTKRPVTLYELSRICADLKLTKAMNFDGGGSTSLNFRGNGDTNSEPMEIVSDKNQKARKLKSFLIIN